MHNRSECVPVNTSAMYKQVLFFFVSLHLSFALFYKPRHAQVCPLQQQVQYEERVLQAKLIDIQRVPLPVHHLQFKTVIATSTLSVTSFKYHTVTVSAPWFTVTDVVRVETTIPIALTSVTTVTSELLETQVSIITRTATNYHTHVETKTVLQTLFLTSTKLESKLVPVIVIETHFAPSTETQKQLFTKKQIHPVTNTVFVTSTLVQQETHTSTVTLITKAMMTICPSGY